MFNKQQAAEMAAIRKRTLVLFHAWVQVRGPEPRQRWKPLQRRGKTGLSTKSPSHSGSTLFRS